MLLLSDNQFPYSLLSPEVEGYLISKAEAIIFQILIPWVSNTLLTKVRIVEGQLPLKRMAMIFEDCHIRS